MWTATRSEPSNRRLALSTVELERAVGEVLIDAETLQARIHELGDEITADYAGRELLLVGVLKGAVFFMADLMRSIGVPCEIDFMAISSYGASTDSSGVVRILKDLDINIEGRHVLVIEDIIDSGLTLSYLVRNLESREPASLEVCALLTKPERREIEVDVRYVGLRDPEPVRDRLRPRFRRALPESALCGCPARPSDARRASSRSGLHPKRMPLGENGFRYPLSRESL